MSHSRLQIFSIWLSMFCVEHGFGKSQKVANCFPQKEKLRKLYMSETKDVLKNMIPPYMSRKSIFNFFCG